MVISGLPVLQCASPVPTYLDQLAAASAAVYGLARTERKRLTEAVKLERQ